MYLRLLETREIGGVFVRSALLLSLVEAGKRGEQECYEFDSLRFGGVSESQVEELESTFSLKRITVDWLLASIMEMIYAKSPRDSECVLGSLEDLHEEFEQLYEEVIIDLLQLTKTHNADIWAKPDIRLSFIKGAISKFVDEGEVVELLESTSPRDRKIVLFELIGICCNSGGMNHGKRELIRHITEKFDVDFEFVAEAETVWGEFFALEKSGLDAIDNASSSGKVKKMVGSVTKLGSMMDTQEKRRKLFESTQKQMRSLVGKAREKLNR